MSSNCLPQGHNSQARTTEADLVPEPLVAATVQAAIRAKTLADQRAQRLRATARNHAVILIVFRP